ncbi:MAG: hypothetical protein ABIU63_08490 [Chitinophagaceae bacterium]
MESSGILLMFFLGLRHGFDPDHIAIIDGVSIQYATSKPLLAAWTGSLFALGHGIVITAVAVTISLFSHSFHLPQALWSLLDWVPGLLLLLVGFLNLRSLLHTKTFKPHAIRSFILPARLKKSSHPLAIVLMGILFALVFDSTTQAAAWAYTATAQITTSSALILGLSFSAGMVITDSADSGILYLLVKRSGNNGSVINYRRTLGWIIVCISLTAGVYKIVSLVIPTAAIQDRILSMIGGAFFVLMLCFYTAILFSSKKLNPGNHGH